MDIKKIINDIVDKVKSDPDIAENFKNNPVKTIEKLAGIDLPDDMIEKVVDGVKAKIGADKASDALNKLKNLF